MVLAGLSTAAMAGSGSYAMVVHEDTLQAGSIMSLDYDRIRAAITRLEGVGFKSFDVYNNLCVGYTMTKAFEKAEVACDAAVQAHDAINDDSRPYLGFGSTNTAERRQAVALTNRGVLKAVSGDMLGAREDFAAASELSSAVKAASVNLERVTFVIDETSAIAQVEP
jgi:hypothetical protein